MENPGSYQLAKGGTYAMSLLTFIPRGIWPTKPKNPKLEVGSAILGYSPLRESTRQYGLAGESMLNFNYYGIIPVFILYGLAVAGSEKGRHIRTHGCQILSYTNHLYNLCVNSQHRFRQSFI